VATALDVRDVSGRWLVGGLADVIGDHHALLVLDNCEHLRDSCAVLADTLLVSCRQLRILATSRQPLDVNGESVYAVPPLPTPGPTDDQEVAGYDAVRLLLERARAAVPSLEFTAGDYAALGELCRRLDGLPLAIELAAVRLRTLGPEDLLARLEDRFQLLRRTGAAIAERHRTLRATLQWSYELLEEGPRSPRGRTTLAGRAADRRPTRFAGPARGLAVAGFLALATFDPATAVPQLEQARVLAAATSQAFIETFATQFLGQAALFQGELRRAGALLREAADRYLKLDPRYSAFCLADVGVTAWLAGSYHEAAAAFEESLVRNQGGDPWTRSHALWGLGLVRLRTDHAQEATNLELEALQLMRRVDDRSGVARCVEALAWTAAAQQEWERAARLAGAARAVWRSIPADLPSPLVRYRDEYITKVRRALGDRRWSALHEEGSALQRVEAVALALGGPRKIREQPRRSTGNELGRLTRRQQEVAALVAQGLTDREIAARLVVSPRTAEYHVEQILTRLGFRSRAEIAAWAATQQAIQASTPDLGKPAG
jgi:DNA-binding CsgD family transcriptional regulator